MTNQPNDKHTYEQLRTKVTYLLLAANSPAQNVPELKALVDEHQNLVQRLAELKALEAKITEVLPMVEQVEASVAEAENHVLAEKKQLASFARELGRAVFAGFQAGELPDQPILGQRKQLQTKIDALQQQRSALLAEAKATFLDKTKQQAQQLALAGQIKIEELKIGSTDRALGEVILTSGEEGSHNCRLTESVLKSIAQQRHQISLTQENHAKVKEQSAKRKAECSTRLERQSLCSGDLKKELKEIRSEAARNTKWKTNLCEKTLQLALKNEVLLQSPAIGPILRQLGNQQDLKSNTTRQLAGHFNSTKATFNRFATANFRRVLMGGTILLCLLLFGTIAVRFIRSNTGSQAGTTMGDLNQYRIATKKEDKGLSIDLETPPSREISPEQQATTQKQANTSENIPAPRTEKNIDPGIAKWDQWPKPNDIVKEMATLSMLQATKPINHSFVVLSKITETSYEIQIEQPLQSAGRAVLTTGSTIFESEGRAVLPLIYMGSETFVLSNGFERRIRVFQQADDLTPQEASRRQIEYYKEMRSLQRMLVCSAIHFKTPITDNKEDFFAEVGAEEWEQTLKDETANLSQTNTTQIFELEIIGAFQGTQEALRKAYNPVQYAAQLLDLPTLEALVHFGEDLSDLGDHGSPSLHLAFLSCLKRDWREIPRLVPKIIDWFSAHGVDVNQLDSKKQTLVHLLATADLYNLGIEVRNNLLQLLKDKGMNYKAANSDGQTAVHLAIATAVHPKSGASILAANQKITRPASLSKESVERLSELLDVLSKYGSDIITVDALGNNLGHMACEVADVELLKMVISKGVDVNQKNRDGDTPLLILSKRWGKSEDDIAIYHVKLCIDVLLANNADKLIKNNDEHYAAFYLGDSTRHLLLLGSHKVNLATNNWNLFLVAGQNTFFIGTKDGNDHKVVVLSDSGKLLGSTDLEDLSGPLATQLVSDGQKLRVTDRKLFMPNSSNGAGISDSVASLSLKVWDISTDGKASSTTINFRSGTAVHQNNGIDRSLIGFSGSGFIRYENVHTDDASKYKTYLVSYSDRSEELWRFELSRLSIPMQLTGDLIQIVDRENSIATLIHKGQKVASLDLKKLGLDSQHAPTQVVLIKDNKIAIRTDDSFLIVDSNGEIMSKTPVGYGPGCTLAIFDMYAIVGNNGHELYCIDCESGKKLWKINNIVVEGGVQRSKDGEWYMVVRSILEHNSSLVRYSAKGQFIGKCQLPGFGLGSSFTEKFCWLDQSRCAFLGIVEEELGQGKSQPYLTIIDTSKW